MILADFNFILGSTAHYLEEPVNFVIAMVMQQPVTPIH